MALQVWDGTNPARVDNRGLRTSLVPRGNAYSVTGTSGTVAAALAANSSTFAMRLDPGSGVLAYIERVRLMFTTIAVFTTLVTAGRRLALFRGSGAAASGGTALAAVAKDSTSAPSECNIAQGGDIRIATTAALTVTGITFETDPIRTMTLSHVGAAGAYVEALFEFHASECAPILLQPGQVLGVRNPVAMDAGGTFQLAVNVDWYEALAYAA